jgi:hypothetical protein
MNRCYSPSRFLHLCLATFVGLLVLANISYAQIAPRNFPANALRGTLQVTAPPEVAMDGKAARLAPGARIYDRQNLLALSGSLVGQELLVNYTRDTVGNVQLVWILTAEEARERRAKQPGTGGILEFFGL